LPREHFSLEDQKVLTVDQWAALNGFSRATALRRLKSGDGPPHDPTLTAPHRHPGDNRRWQESRMRSA
jgi:hypothetical protein